MPLVELEMRLSFYKVTPHKHVSTLSGALMAGIIILSVLGDAWGTF